MIAGVIKVVDLLLRCFAVVVSQQPTESFATDDVSSGLANFVARFDESVAETLMIPLSMIMREILANGVSQ